jgi:hypothetical protein
VQRHPLIDNNELSALDSLQKRFFSQAALSKAYLELSKSIHRSETLEGQNKEKLIATLADQFSEHPQLEISDGRKQELKLIFQKLVNQMDHLTSSEKNELHLIVNSRLDYTAKDRNKALGSLKRYLPETIFRLTENSQSLKLFCETNRDLEKTWGDILKAAGQLDERIQSLEGDISVSVYDQYIGTFILNKLGKSREASEGSEETVYDKDLLKIACERGLFQALQFRCEINQKMLALRETPLEPGSALIHEILHDAKKFTAYSAIGTYAGSQMLLALADTFAKFGDQKNSDLYHRKSIEYICKAYLLEDQPHSQKLLRIYNQGNGLTSEEDNKDMLLEGSSIDAGEYAKIRTQQENWLNGLKVAGVKPK